MLISLVSWGAKRIAEGSSNQDKKKQNKNEKPTMSKLSLLSGSISLIWELGGRLPSELCQGLGILVMDSHLSFEQ